MDMPEYWHWLAKHWPVTATPETMDESPLHAKKKESGRLSLA